MLEEDDIAPHDENPSLLWSERGKQNALCIFTESCQTLQVEGER